MKRKFRTKFDLQRILLSQRVLCIEEPNAGGGGGGTPAGGGEPAAPAGGAPAGGEPAAKEPAGEPAAKEPAEPAAGAGEPKEPAGGEPAAKEPVAEPKKEDELSIRDKMEAVNKKADEELEKEEEGGEPKAEGEEAEPAAGEGEPAEAKTYEFTKELDEETFKAQREEFLASFEESPVLETVKSILAVQDEKLAEATAANAAYQAVGDVDTVKKTFDAFGELFTTKKDGDELVPNTAPLVNLLRKDYPNELPALARNIFMLPSGKYQGANMFQEQIMDAYGLTPAQVNAITQYMEAPSAAALPKPAEVFPVSLKSHIEEKYAEAFYDLPEPKRHALEEMGAEVARLNREIEDVADDASRAVYKNELIVSRNKIAQDLDSEVSTIMKVQAGIDAGKQTQQNTIRQAYEAKVEYRNSLFQAHTQAVFEIGDTYAQELAPKLEFLEENQRPGFASAISAKVGNALNFYIGEDREGKIAFEDDPAAEYWAKQLKSEGVDYDFNEGRKLIQNRYLALDKLMTLKAGRNTSPEAIRRAQSELDTVNKEIKAAKLEIMGKQATTFVKSQTKKLQTDIDTAKKQAVKNRFVPVGGAASTKPKAKVLVGDELKQRMIEHNRKVDNDEEASPYA